MGDVRALKNNVKFYFELSGIVSQTQTAYFHGKGYARVVEAWKKLGLRQAAVGTVCTTRFCASERKVYKAFGRNLVVFVTDLKTVRSGEVGCHELATSISNITFVVRLFGTIDLLRPLKDLSLTMQVPVACSLLAARCSLLAARFSLLAAHAFVESA